MNRLSPTAAPADHAPGFKGIRFNLDWITRPLFGCALAALTIGAIYAGAPSVALFVAIAGIAAAREWHRMLGEPVFGPAFFITSVTVVAALAVQLLSHNGLAALVVLAAGAAASGLYAGLRGRSAAWHGAGAFYFGLPALALVALRGAAEGAWIIVGLFIAVWATDTAALFVGNLVGGPRLWPALSPNKTWAGTLGGVAAAALFEALYIGILGGDALSAALLGAGIAVVAHAGDLFESWVKRVFQRKDSGGLIPGHGGMLDRIDSTLFAAPALAFAVVILGFGPMLGAHP